MSGKKETVLKVEGMTCQSCVRHVQGALGVMAGVDAVEVSLEHGTARVQHDPQRASVERILDAITEAGYEARAAEVGRCI